MLRMYAVQNKWDYQVIHITKPMPPIQATTSSRERERGGDNDDDDDDDDTFSLSCLAVHEWLTKLDHLPPGKA